MLFAHDTRVALESAAALVNTAHSEPDPLATEAGLDAFLTAWRFSSVRSRYPEELSEVRELRPRLEQLWFLDTDDAVTLVNALLRDARALPQLVRHDGWDYHLHAVPDHAPLAERMTVETAMAMVDVIRMGELDRLRVCAAIDCNDVMIDCSKNRSRRFCNTTCANRTNVAAFRARARGGEA